ncbi:uncharacterized protein PV09_05920 [Verruconis gallopava]|uniref:Amidase domain-containing protein n=1 Tax=Verruconis gallopava TaxID=253628 RepID=A0A0D2A7Y2_9PEZI|nr:uncharacterized protein PV09_05920 [Verruconis gallopava]KIW02868.1 hypothetical protein PV09_05920 [Verruconis gallopava]
MYDVRDLTVAKAHDAFRKGPCSCKDLTEMYLDRIVRLDKSGPKICSTLALSSTALDEAASLDAYYRRYGRFKGRLHGIPILIKDQADTRGIETMYGSIAARGNVPEGDAFVVKKLKDEGAIVLGKTTMSEWASTWSSASTATNWEFTRNPYKTDHDVGGSSSGSAAAVAANFALLAVAEDTGGSIRCPASFRNLVGIRITPGPVARTVSDCALMLDCMVGYDPADDFTGVNLVAAAPKGGSYSAGLDPDKIKSARIGLVRELFGPDSNPYCRAVNAVVEGAMSKLRASGTTFVDVSIDNLKHHMTFTPNYLQMSRSDINAFLATKPHLPQDIAEIVPKKPQKMFLDFTSMMAHGPENPTDDPLYVEKLLDSDRFQRTLNCLMLEKKLDPSAFPDCQVPPPRQEDATNGRFPTCWDFPINTLLASQARLAAVTVPAGFTEEGLPVGLEFVSWEYREKELLELARGMEVIVDARRSPPPPL